MRTKFGATGVAAGLGAKSSCHQPSVMLNDSMTLPEPVCRFLIATSPATPMSTGDMVTARTRMGECTPVSGALMSIHPGLAVVPSSTSRVSPAASVICTSIRAFTPDVSTRIESA